MRSLTYYEDNVYLNKETEEENAVNMNKVIKNKFSDKLFFQWMLNLVLYTIAKYSTKKTEFITNGCYFITHPFAKIFCILTKENVIFCM